MNWVGLWLRENWAPALVIVLVIGVLVLLVLSALLAAVTLLIEAGVFALLAIALAILSLRT